MVRASVFAILGLLTAAIPTAADAPKLTFLQPAGGQRGTEVTVTCHGEFPWPVQVDMEGVHVGTLEEKGKLKLQIPQNLNQDRAWIRLYNDEGASERVPFLIGNLADVSEQEPNDALEQAQQLERQTSTVNGLLEKNGDSDAFAVECQAGQVLIAALEANAALGSPMDAILQIVSREGNILAENHDCVGLDPRVVYEVTESGTYYVRLFAFAANPNTSIRYHGGDDYVYRLTITTGPFISHVTPSIVQDPEHDDQHGGTVERSGEIVVTPIGWNIAGGTRLLAFAQGASGASTSGEVENDSDFRLSPTSRLGLVHAPGFAGRLRVRLDRYDTVSGTTCPVPGSHCGCLTEPRQIDSFALAVAKEQPIVILVESPGIDSPLAPEVVLTEPSGKVVSEAG
ncbi:MAG: PPC domain-containing protein [Planctomycetales bacterium]|nr:PPC domain-containing protein [Planctomycetales bacterium]